MAHREKPPAGRGYTARSKKGAGQTPASPVSSRLRLSVNPLVAWLVAVAILSTTLAVYWQAVDFGFIRNDDELYVYDNAAVKGGLGWAGAVHAFTRPAAGNWHPLTILSLMLDSQLGGLAPAWFHAANILLHLLGTLCLFLAFHVLTGCVWRSLFVAAVFALHPTHVESVAWISARKDVLSGVFLGLTLLAYNRYSRHPDRFRYAGALVCLLLGLLSKPVLVSVPILLLLIDYWPLKRIGGADALVPSIGWRKVIREKVPLGILAGAFAVVTFVVQRGSGAVDTLESTPVQERLSNALVAYATYMGKFFWPDGLAGLYPYLREARPFWQPAGALTLLVIITYIALRNSSSRPWFLVGWLWYLISLIPMIGLVQVGPQASADRYTYIPYIGLSIILAWGIPEIFTFLSPNKWRRIPTILGAVAAVAMGVHTYRYLPHWKDDAAFWSRVVEIRPDFGRGYYNLALAVGSGGDTDRAMALYRRALEVDNRCVDAHYGLANLLLIQGRLEEAVTHYQEELRLNPRRSGVHNNLAIVLGKLGRPQQAMDHYRAALEADPNNADALRNWGMELINQKDWEGARAKYDAYLKIQPDDYDAHCRIAAALAGEGNFREAVNHLRRAIRIQPDNPAAFNNLGTLLTQRGDHDAAIEQFRHAAKLDAGFVEARYNLAMALSVSGRKADAIAAYRDVLRTHPDHYWAHNGVGILLAEQGDLDQALAHFDAALKIDPGGEAARHNREGVLALRSRRGISGSTWKRVSGK